jgi:cold shock CspA family protein
VEERSFGKVVRWCADRGFGWIRSDAAQAPDLFVHVRHTGGGPLEVGTRVSYEASKQADGRWQAKHVRVVGDSK